MPILAPRVTAVSPRARLTLLVLAFLSSFLLGGSSDASPGVSRDARAASAACSKATAKRLLNQHRLNRFVLPNPVEGVLCGPFTGTGSQAMAVTVLAPTCWGVQNWAVFTLSGGTWRLVLDQPAYLHPPLVRVGAGIRETTAVHRPGDSRCFPSGGKRSRIWRWNGSRLVASAWKYATPGGPPSAEKSGYFKTPSGNIVCHHSVGSGVPTGASIACGIKSGLVPPPPRRPCAQGGYANDRVFLTATGGVSVPSCAGDPGALIGEREARVLAYGTTWSGAGIRCTSAEVGLTCRNKSGHGFFLSRERWRRF